MISKEEQKRLLIEMMKEDEKNGMYKNELELTNDELIAQFMEHNYLVVAPNYKNWNAIMDVVENIEILIDDVIIESEYVTIEGDGSYGSLFYCKQTTFETEDESKLDIVYRAVIDFIKWFNSQQHERK